MISIIIPVYNDEKNLLDCVKSLQNQKTKEKFEIIIVEDGSNSNIEKNFKEMRNIRYFWKSNGGPASARNFGLKKSKGELIVFIDSDCIAEKNWLSYLHEEIISSNNISGVGGRILNKNNGYISDSLHLLEFEGFTNIRGNEKRIIPTANALFRRKDLELINGFDNSLNLAGGDDVDLCWRLVKLKKKLIFYPKAIIYHKTSTKFSKALKKVFVLGKGTFKTRKIHKDLPYSKLTNQTIILLLMFLILPFISSFRKLRKSQEISFFNKVKYFPMITLFYFFFWFGVIIERWKN